MATFEIIPAIDLRGGKCVRLIQGDYNQETVYNDDPVEVALTWERLGAGRIHVVDLDGAKEGRPVHDELIGEMARKLQVPIQVGGGLRNKADVERLLSLGAARVIIGTAAIEDRAFVEAILGQHGERVVIGIDARNGYVATRGWLETSEVEAESLAVALAEMGADTFIFTDISRDGMLKGPNVEAIASLARATMRQVVASGGVGTIEDLENLAACRKDGVAGAIVGKALYTGKIRLDEAIRRLEQA